MKSTFTNLQGKNLNEYFGYKADTKCLRTPQTDERDVNSSTTMHMSSSGFKALEKGAHGKNFIWTTDINQELPIKMGSAGMSHHLQPETLSVAFRRTAL